MLFNSLAYLLYLPSVSLGYFALPYAWRWLWLLLASCYFYMFFIPKYILILFFLILIDYTAGRLIDRAQGRRRRLILIVSLCANIAVLGFYKYFNFANANLARLAEFLHWNYPIENLSIILPIGLSFHTFQSMSYTIEVYRGAQKAEKHLGIFALYVMFFPQLVAGPIERPQNLLHQLRDKHDFDYHRAVKGMKWILWGLLKKMLIADNLAQYVDAVYAGPAQHGGASLALACVFFSIQIYCDFSGYSDIAIGSAKILGVNLMENFRAPYFARSIPEFWRRWHISLSTWFKDYAYIPLGGSRGTRGRTLFNLMAVFLVSGLWHGARWSFVAWGALHGLFMAFSILGRNFRARLTSAVGLNNAPNLLSALQTATTFLLVTVAWVFFRAASLSDALYVLTHLHEGWARGLDWSVLGAAFGSPRRLALFGVIALALLVSEIPAPARQPLFWIRQKPLPVRWAFYSSLCWILLWFGVFGEGQFIYFQF